MKKIIIVLLMAVVGLTLTTARSAYAVTLPTPPFTQCPAVGADTSCGILIVFNADGTTSIISDP